MMEIKKYRGTLGRAIIHIFIYGFISGLALEFIILFASMLFQGTLIWQLYALFHWPKGLFWSMTVSAGILFLRHTTVEIGTEKINIRRVGHQECFHLSQFLSSSVIRKTHIGSYSKFVTVKCYLVFETPQGIQRCRLYGFGEKDLERTLEAVKNARIRHFSAEEKTAIVTEYTQRASRNTGSLPGAGGLRPSMYTNEAADALIHGRTGNNEFLLPASELIDKEKECLRKISLITAGIVILVGIMDLYAIFVNQILTLRLFFLTLLALMLLALLLAMYIDLARKRSICAERIVTDGEHLTIGGDYYSYAYIEKIRLTSPRKKSSSIFPVQRYIYVSANGMTKKYWLGSEVSFRAYGGLCRSLELSMVLHPSKLRYK